MLLLLSVPSHVPPAVADSSVKLQYWLIVVCVIDLCLCTIDLSLTREYRLPLLVDTQPLIFLNLHNLSDHLIAISQKHCCRTPVPHHNYNVTKHTRYKYITPCDAIKIAVIHAQLFLLHNYMVAAHIMCCYYYSLIIKTMCFTTKILLFTMRHVMLCNSTNGSLNWFSKGMVTIHGLNSWYFIYIFFNIPFW